MWQFELSQENGEVVCAGIRECVDYWKNHREDFPYALYAFDKYDNEAMLLEPEGAADFLDSLATAFGGPQVVLANTIGTINM